MSSGRFKAGIETEWGGRTLAPLVLLMSTVLSGCFPQAQAGDPEQAALATHDFLTALSAGRVDYAWDHLTPATREAVYGDERAAFADDVTSADWRAFDWAIGPVTDYDISWGVHVEVEPDAIPEFLIDRRLAAPYDNEGIILLVQFTGDRYVIAGQALDTDLR